jgi:hypothetical protein
MNMEKKPIISDKNLVAYCGLYCGACKSYIKGTCPGCHDNTKATWCKIRSCNIEHGYTSCADCKEFSDPMECGKFNNFFSKFFALIFRSDRAACVAKVKELGYDGFAAFMAENQLQTIRRN